MEFSDLLIIYFAAGAPFGVYRITTVRGRPDLKAIVNVALYLCLWPVYTILLLRDQFSAGTTDVSSGVIDSIRTGIEQLAFANGSAGAIFEFREIFNRYAGLSEAAMAEVPTTLLGEFFELSSSDNKPLASACIARRNREKLALHHTRARNEFVDLISGLAISHPQTLDLAVRLASHVHDADAVADLESFSYKPPQPTSGPSMRQSRSAHV